MDACTTKEDSLSPDRKPRQKKALFVTDDVLFAIPKLRDAVGRAIK